MADEFAPRRRALDDWRAGLQEERAVSRQREDGWVAAWSGFVLVLMVLYLMIGQSPYTHQVTRDALTGAAQTSTVNRTIWLALLALSLPIVWLRRSALVDLAKRLWPLLLLFVWFGATTRWAIDPSASNKRFILYVINLLVCMALITGLRDARRMHMALATACAAIILIDLFSWIVLPAKSMTVLGVAAIHNHKNTLGVVMLLCAMVILPYVIFLRSLAARAVWGALFVGCLVLLVVSKSKTSLALVVVLMAMIPALLMCLRLRSGALLALIAIGGLALLGAVFGWTAWSYINGKDPLYPLHDVTFTQRTDVWAFALGEFAQRPIRGVGFSSFWDIDPMVQPSLQTGAWFADDTYTNESHNGYIDILVTTGVFGLAGALILLTRWMLGGLAFLRRGLLDPSRASQDLLPHALFLATFPLIFFVHNWMESSFFIANAMFGILMLLVGVDIDMQRPEATERKPAPRRRRAPPSASPLLPPSGWRS
ncbi:O-antigen ligase [Caulobacter sp. RHG1]|uniref:O-antigen ligase family protein n=1 Tax=Caulobacter sp. (strain RHG1) TaxID=2545762 RepID=UPI00155378B4|nr:O-antigen ligase family protein [Caulobacter sp. RHG1]